MVIGRKATNKGEGTIMVIGRKATNKGKDTIMVISRKATNKGEGTIIGKLLGKGYICSSRSSYSCGGDCVCIM